MDMPQVTYHEVISPDGVRLCVCSGGVAGAQPIVFLHGYSQSHLAWAKQFAGPLAREFALVAFDLRGHGFSDKPNDIAAYHESERWAHDVGAVLDALELQRPVLVAWSYGGRVVCDTIASPVGARIGGINFVAGVVASGGEVWGPDARLTGKAADPVPARSIAAARRFLSACFAERPPQDDFETMVAYNAMCPPHVRAMLGGRSLDAKTGLAALRVPVLFTQGLADRIVAPAMSRFGVDTVPGSRISIYDNVGHAPFYEEPERFDRELAAFARSCRQ